MGSGLAFCIYLTFITFTAKKFFYRNKSDSDYVYNLYVLYFDKNKQE